VLRIEPQTSRFQHGHTQGNGSILYNKIDVQSNISLWQINAAEVYRRTLRSTSWVIVPLGNGMASTGTAWVVDRVQRLLVTNPHVVGNQGSALVGFPAYRNGHVIAERAKYYPNNGIPARVVATTVNEDNEYSDSV